jgi:disulfide bond formation protein DsbB
MLRLIDLICHIHQRPAQAALLGAAGSAGLLAAAYVFQYGFGYLPCTLCYWQRGPHFALVLMGLLALLLKNRKARLILLSLMALTALGNAGLALFHTGVEQQWWKGLSSCAAPTAVATDIEAARALIYGSAQVVACDSAAWVFMGLSMASWNGLFCLALFGWYATAFGAGVKR